MLLQQVRHLFELSARCSSATSFPPDNRSAISAVNLLEWESAVGYRNLSGTYPHAVGGPHKKSSTRYHACCPGAHLTASA